MPLTDKYFFFTHYADEIDEQLLKEMSVLFSENYGVRHQNFVANVFASRHNALVRSI